DRAAVTGVVFNSESVRTLHPTEGGTTTSAAVRRREQLRQPQNRGYGTCIPATSFQRGASPRYATIQAGNMVSAETIGSIFIKVFKVVINIVVLIIYRTGYGGDFLGIGGTWNLNEEKSPDAEIVASGVFVGFIIYTGVQLITFGFGTTKHKYELSDTIMNVVGTFMWVAVGGTALHYWHGYLAEHDFENITSERTAGLALGALCVINGALYLADTVLAFIHYTKYA
uniref:MARVEL domain-containing protein n=2 Tax=Anopheles atroparvus TaxID=41427 RepID=A0A182IQH7_ANOAO